MSIFCLDNKTKKPGAGGGIGSMLTQVRFYQPLTFKNISLFNLKISMTFVLDEIEINVNTVLILVYNISLTVYFGNPKTIPFQSCKL